MDSILTNLEDSYTRVSTTVKSNMTYEGIVVFTVVIFLTSYISDMFEDIPKLIHRFKWLVLVAIGAAIYTNKVDVRISILALAVFGFVYATRTEQFVSYVSKTKKKSN